MVTWDHLRVQMFLSTTLEKGGAKITVSPRKLKYMKYSLPEIKRIAVHSVDADLFCGTALNRVI